MTIPLNPQEPYTPFLPTTYDIPEEGRLRSFFSENLASFADVINDKKIGIYMQAAETLNGDKFFYKTTRKTRNGYQSISYIPSFPNSGVLVITRDTDPQYPMADVNEQLIVTQVWGSASKPCTSVGSGDADYFSFMAQGDGRISFTFSDTTLTITTTIDMTAYSGFIVVQYVRDGI